jgi:hypothetical protein
MIQYVKQKDLFRCVPIAFLNVLKWLEYKEFHGHRVNYRFMQTYLTDWLQCNAQEGGASWYLLYEKLKTLSDAKCTLVSDVRCWQPSKVVISPDQICIIDYFVEDHLESHGHVATLMYYLKGLYTVINWEYNIKWSQVPYKKIHQRATAVGGIIIQKKDKNRCHFG